MWHSKDHNELVFTIPGPSLNSLGISPLYNAKKLQCTQVKIAVAIRYNTHPSSRATILTVFIVCLYLLGWSIGWGPWILLLATSKGMFEQVANVPEANPNKNFPTRDTEYPYK